MSRYAFVLALSRGVRFVIFRYRIHDFCVSQKVFHKLLEPYAMKVACTVLRGGKIERSYLSQQKVAGSNPATLII